MTDQHGNEWHINDTRGYLDAGPSCDECGACECEPCEACKGKHDDCDNWDSMHGEACIGLSVAYVCLDGGESLCGDCFDKSGVVLTEDKE